MAIELTQGLRSWSVPILAGLATVSAITIGAFAGPLGLLIGWLGGALACGLVLRAAGDPKATRATLTMIALLPATTVVQSLLLLPLWAVAGPWVAGSASVLVTGLTPTVAMAMAGSRSVAEYPATAARWLWLRLGLGVCSAAVIVTGHLVVQLAPRPGSIDEGFLALLVLDLVPALIYLVGTRRPATIMASGYLLFLSVAGGWTLFRIEDGNQFAGVWVFFGWTLALVVATAGAMRDYAVRGGMGVRRW